MARNPLYIKKRYDRDNITRFAMQQFFRRDTFLRVLAVESAEDTPIFDFVLHPDTWAWLKDSTDVRIPIGKLTAGSVQAQTVVQGIEQAEVGGVTFNALFKYAEGDMEQRTSGYVGEVLGHRLYTDQFYETSERITDGYIAIQVARYADMD